MTETEKKQDEQSLEGWDAPVATAEDRRRAVEYAFDYRGDVTLVTTDGRELEGYIFDRAKDADKPTLRLMKADGERVTVAYDEIKALQFTGRDAAHGKSFETWMRKYIEKKTGKKA